MNKKILVLMLNTIFIVSEVYADNLAIVSANNQAFLDGQWGYSNINYGSNHPADAGAPLFNAHSTNWGAQLGLAKTFGRIYTQFMLGMNQANIRYSDAAVDASPLSSGNLVTLSLNARLGYSFYPTDKMALTPYLLGGYMNNQLDTGGYSNDFISSNYNGATFVTQSFFYGLGLMDQWAVNPCWVLSANAQWGTEYHPWVNGNVNNFNTPVSATTAYQQWNLSPVLFWRLGLGSDYLVYTNLHLRAGISYEQQNLGGENSAATGVFPAQYHHSWSGIVGLGYNFADMKLAGADPIGCGTQEIIHAATNQGSLHLGYQSQTFNGGTTFYPYYQNSGMPSLGIVFSKTWGKVYTQLAAKEAFGYSSSQGKNTSFDAAGKLGYQFASSQNTALTPYATLGYHRSLQNVKGTPDNSGAINNIFQTFYVNGITETYQHSWYGIGLLAQWAVSSKLVLNVDGNIGRTFNANMHSWTPLDLPVYLTYGLGNACYQMLGAGADYALGKNWHASANVGYWHYNYNASSTNAYTIATKNDSIRQINADVGLGYSFG